MDLFVKNQNFFQKISKKIYEMLQEAKPAAKLVIDGDSYQILDGDSPRYMPDAIHYAKRAVATHRQSPNKTVLATPKVSSEKPEVLDKINVDEDFSTKKYDNSDQDTHFAWFTYELSKRLLDKNIEVVKNITDPQPNFLFVFGVGLGFHLKEFIDKVSPRVMVIVDSNVDDLKLSLEVFDWPEFVDYAKAKNCDVKIIIEKTAAGIKGQIAKQITGLSLSALDGMQSHLFKVNDPALKIAFGELNKETIGNLAHFIGFTTDEYNMLKNSFRNLRTGKSRMLNATAHKTNVPVLITGSGPSLEKNINFIKENRDSFILISSGSSLSVLLSHNIVPDFHCNLERARSILERHEELNDPRLKQITAVMTTTIWPGIDNFFKDTIYFLRPALCPFAIFMEDWGQVMLMEGPQVTNTSVGFARKLNPSHILLLGVDMGTTDLTAPRASGAWQAQRPRFLTIPVRGNGGKTVFTDLALLQQRDALEVHAREYLKEQPGGKFINLGEGVYIPGTISAAPNFKISKKIVNRETLVDMVTNKYNYYTRDRFTSAWDGADPRRRITEYAKAIRNVLDGTDGWGISFLHQIEEINRYLGKPNRNQLCPRMFRGSYLRALMHANSVYIRLKDRAHEKQAIEILRETLRLLVDRVEREGYSLIDELEAEDDAFKNIQHLEDLP